MSVAADAQRARRGAAMIKIQFEKWDEYGRTTTAVEWPAVPRVGDVVDFSVPDSSARSRLVGDVKTVVWWSDGSCRVVLK
jgi:hypothetical protein